MKKALLIFASVISIANSQCWEIPQNCSQVEFTGSITAGFNGNTRVNTSGVLTIKAASTFTGWNVLAFITA